jgi:aspartate carbamoyltransferase catalytic subunit
MISNMLSLRHCKKLISIDDFQNKDIEVLFSIVKTENFSFSKGGLFLSVFFENSTRTLLSFEKSAYNCGLNVMRFDVSSSSIAKEESEINTIRTLNELEPKVIALRCKKTGEPNLYSRYLSEDIVILNAGDGINEHPTQALLDLFTILQAMGKGFSGDCLKGVKIGIMGDVMHSRVARSNIFLLSRLGAKITLICPPNFLSQNFGDFYVKNFGVKIETNYNSKFDFLMLLRVQKERIEGSGKICYPSNFGVFCEEDLKGAFLLHPGPVNIGVETSEELVYESSLSLVSKQVANGVLIRSGVIKYCLVS